MDVNFNGYNENVLTFIADSGITNPGVPVKISASGKVSKCSTNDVFCGVCVNVRDGYAAVQLSGYVQLPATGTITPGYTKVAINSAGRVAADSEHGKEMLVVYSTSNEVGIIL